MIFGTGLVLSVIGWLVVVAFGAPPRGMNRADYLGVTAMLIGSLMMLTSVAIYAWKVMP